MSILSISNTGLQYILIHHRCSYWHVTCNKCSASVPLLHVTCLAVLMLYFTFSSVLSTFLLLFKWSLLVSFSIQVGECIYSWGHFGAHRGASRCETHLCAKLQISISIPDETIKKWTVSVKASGRPFKEGGGDTTMQFVYNIVVIYVLMTL